jgi:hypothetical protein
MRSVSLFIPLTLLLSTAMGTPVTSTTDLAAQASDTPTKDPGFEAESKAKVEAAIEAAKAAELLKEYCDTMCTSYWNCVRLDMWNGVVCDPPDGCGSCHDYQ